MKAHRTSIGIVPLFLNLSTKWRWVVSLKLFWGNSLQYPLNSREGYGHFREEEYHLLLLGFKPWVIQALV
jgi:hypothetical protein